MSGEAPNHVYYRACEGAWSCDFELEISDPAAFRACPMGWLDRQRVTSMVRWARLTGPFVFATTVDYASRGARGEVVHTARMAKFGATFLRSTEVLTLDANGRDFTLRGEQRFWPTGRWRSRSFAGHGRVDETATRATYDFEWFGTRMRQTTIRHDLGVDIYQESPWSRGTQRLRRVAVLPAQ